MVMMLETIDEVELHASKGWFALVCSRLYPRPSSKLAFPEASLDLKNQNLQKPKYRVAVRA